MAATSMSTITIGSGICKTQLNYEIEYNSLNNQRTLKKKSSTKSEGMRHKPLKV